MTWAVFTFGIVAIMAVHTNSKFLTLFAEMLKAIGLEILPLPKGSLRINRVKKYHRC